ncbi:MAG: cofactor assembly of complex C subunit B [Oscillatoriales cyanobacterium]|nr:MAG: cofactor assembly of complex C subunit B [Oscillatoriales cyanobacterium]
MSNAVVVPSTLFLTVLMLIGLIFFIRASAKDRTELACYVPAALPEDQLRDRLRSYFGGRSYQLVDRDAANDRVTFEGLVAASPTLAVFLSILAAGGLLCLGLVLSMTVPQIQGAGLGLVLLAPAAGWFYQRKAQRTERVQLQLETNEAGAIARLWVKAHRDELIALEESLGLEPTRPDRAA